jgi:chromate transporter
MQSEVSPTNVATNHRVREQFRAWALIGVQSFGGGMATLALIQRSFVDDRRWIGMDEFTRMWGICQLAPGINLIAFAMLIGRRLGGGIGVAVALIGMLLPSVTITLVMTAIYSAIRGSAQVQAALKAVIPATIGIGLVTAIKIAIPLLKQGWSRGYIITIFSILTLCISGLALGLLQLPVIVILLGAGVLNGVVFTLIQSAGTSESESEVSA